MFCFCVMLLIAFCLLNNYQNEKCIDEESDCTQCTETSSFYPGCYRLYIVLMDGKATQNSPSDLWDIDECCSEWVYAQEAIARFDDINCTQGFDIINLNNDEYVSFYEMIVASHDFFDIEYSKAVQINCSLCLGDPSVYY